MPINSHQGLQWPHRSHWCKLAGSVSSQQVREFHSLEEHVSSQRRLSLCAGAASAPCAANNRGWWGQAGHLEAGSLNPPSKCVSDQRCTFLEEVLLRQQQPQGTKGKMQPKPGPRCLFMPSLNNSSLSLLSPSQHVKK